MRHCRFMLCQLTRAALAVAILVAAAPAAANGRLPNTTFFHVNPGNPNQMILGATFGLLISTDGGQTFDYRCEQAIAPPDGFGGADPVVNWAPTGTLTVGSFAAVSTSKDNGCTWQTVNMFSNYNVADLAPQPDVNNSWYIAANDPNGVGAVYRTVDDGATYKALSLTGAGIYWESVRVAPSMTHRIYVVGFKNNVFTGPHVARSDDGGNTWTTVLMNAPSGPKMVSGMTLVVHPTDPNIIFVAATNVQDGTVGLLRSTDAGQTGTQVQQINDIFRQLVFSADASQAWLATGARISRSTDGGMTFTLLAAPSGDACVARVGTRLYGCGNPKVDNYSLATSDDGGSSWKPLFNTSQLLGPGTCPAGTPVQMVCPAPWNLIAGPIGASVGPTGGTLGPPTTSAGSGSGGAGATSGAATQTPAKSGCGCAAAEATASFWLCIAACAGRALRRRRARSRV